VRVSFESFGQDTSNNGSGNVTNKGNKTSISKELLIDFSINVIEDYAGGNPQSYTFYGPSMGVCIKCMTAFTNNSSSNCPNCGTSLMENFNSDHWSFADEA
jgi:hypothetical protein